MKEKFKSFLNNDQYFYGLLLILVSFSSFFLGQKSVSENTLKDNNSALVTVSTQSLIDIKTYNNSSSSSGIKVVASKSGSKYHLESCPGARTIKAENLIVFNSEVEAKAAGYTPAVNCPGLQ